MKFAFTTFSTPDAPWAKVLRIAQRLGYSGIEPRAQSNQQHGIEIDATPSLRQTIRQQVQDAGVAICCIGTSCRFADPASAALNLDHGLNHIDLAADVGCPLIRVFAGHYPEQVIREEATASQVNAMRVLAIHGKARGVTVCLETHDVWSDPRDVATIMQRVNHPNAGVVWDVLHTLRAGKTGPRESYEILSPWIKHVHVHDASLSMERLELLSIGEGDVDHREVLRVLRDAKYDGFVSGEWIGRHMDASFFQEHLEREIAALRRLVEAL